MGLNISAGSGEDVAASMRFAFSASRCEASDEVRRSFAHRGHEMCKGSLLMFFASPIDSVEKKMAPIPLQQKLKKYMNPEVPRYPGWHRTSLRITCDNRDVNSSHCRLGKVGGV